MYSQIWYGEGEWVAHSDNATVPYADLGLQRRHLGLRRRDLRRRRRQLPRVGSRGPLDRARLRRQVRGKDLITCALPYNPPYKAPHK